MFYSMTSSWAQHIKWISAHHSNFTVTAETELIYFTMVPIYEISFWFQIEKAIIQLVLYSYQHGSLIINLLANYTFFTLFLALS